jgi:hypothetical protein
VVTNTENNNKIEDVSMHSHSIIRSDDDFEEDDEINGKDNSKKLYDSETSSFSGSEYEKFNKEKNSNNNNKNNKNKVNKDLKEDNCAYIKSVSNNNKNIKNYSYDKQEKNALRSGLDNTDKNKNKNNNSYKNNSKYNNTRHSLSSRNRSRSRSVSDKRYRKNK